MKSTTYFPMTQYKDLSLCVDLKVTCDKMIAIVETTINYCCNTGGFSHLYHSSNFSECLKVFKITGWRKCRLWFTQRSQSNEARIKVNKRKQKDPQGDGLARWSMGGPRRVRALWIFPKLALKTAYLPRGPAQRALRSHLWCPNRRSSQWLAMEIAQLGTPGVSKNV